MKMIPYILVLRLLIGADVSTIMLTCCSRKADRDSYGFLLFIDADNDRTINWRTPVVAEI
jgi:hypothetical protein